jgi:uncharacterized membrane protein YozB (DUF420 family)
MQVGRANPLDKSFFLAASLAIAGVVAYGFSRTVDQNLLHPSSPRPLILYLHAAVFTAWLLLLIVQSTLIRTGNQRLHRRVGLFGFFLGLSIPIVGIETALVMARWRIEHGSQDATQFLIVPFFDVLAFAVAFGLAITWRKRPEYHRRLMFIASCVLTAAAFGRFPPAIIPDNFWDAGVDALIATAVLRDLVVMHRVHPVFLYGLPALILGQALTMYAFLSASPLWLAIAHSLLS